MSENHALDMTVASDPPPPYDPQDHAPRTSALARTVQSTFYHVYRSYFGSYKILRDNRTPAFYVRSRNIRKPDLIVHQGNGDYDREMANCVFPEFGDFYEINLLQEVNNRSSTVQSKMTSDGRFIAKVPIQDVAGVITSAERAFKWKRTLAMMLFDIETGQTAAVMHDISYGSKICFVLETQATYGHAFEILVVASAMIVYESKRRESSSPSTSRQGFGMGAGPAAVQTGFAGMMGGPTGGGGGF